jgi:hypothetical protein
MVCRFAKSAEWRQQQRVLSTTPVPAAYASIHWVFRPWYIKRWYFFPGPFARRFIYSTLEELVARPPTNHTGKHGLAFVGYLKY